MELIGTAWLNLSAPSSFRFGRGSPLLNRGRGAEYMKLVPPTINFRDDRVFGERGGAGSSGSVAAHTERGKLEEWLEMMQAVGDLLGMAKKWDHFWMYIKR